MVLFVYFIFGKVYVVGYLYGVNIVIFLVLFRFDFVESFVFYELFFFGMLCDVEEVSEVRE